MQAEFAFQINYPILGYGARGGIDFFMAPDPQRREQEILQALLKHMRVSAGLRQSDVARKLGVPQSFVSKYEAGERRLDLVEVRRLCSLFGSSLSKFAQIYEKKLKEGGTK